MGFDYKIGVKLAMTSNMPAMLTALGNQLLGLNVKVDQLTGKFTRLKLAVGGVAGVWAGSKIVEGMAALARHGDKIVEQQAQLRSMGMSAQQIMQATRFSQQVANQVQTTTIAENLRHLGELRYGAGSLKISELILPFLSKANAILKDKVGKEAADQIWPMVKSLEMKGELTPATIPRFKSYIDSMTQAVIATHGKVTPQDFLRNFVYGRTATFGWDLSFMPYMVRAIQSMGTSGGISGGRSGPGNALMSTFAAIVERQMPKQAASIFQALGLAQVSGIHGSAQARLSHVKGTELFQKNPYQWVQEVLMPALAAHGVAMPQGMNPTKLKEMFGNQAEFAEAKQRNDLIGVISQMFRNRTASQMITEFALFGSYMEGKNSMYEKDKTKQAQAMTTDQGFAWLMKSSPWLRKYVVHQQYENMLEAMGKALVPIQMRVLTALTTMFNAIANLSMDHPQIMTALAVGFTAFGAFLIGAGGLAILAAIGVGGWLVVGLGALAGAIGLMAALDWGGMVAGLKTFMGQMKAFANLIAHPFSLRAWEGRDVNTGQPLNPGAPPGFTTAPSGAPQHETWGQWWNNIKQHPGSLFGLPGGSPSGSRTTSTPGQPGTSTWDKSVIGGLDATPVPGGVLAQAAKYAGNPAELQAFMRKMGYPKSGAWCGEFASAVVRAAGGTPPAGSAIASNWRKFGVADAVPHVGDIAVRNTGVTGAPGSHVGFVTKVNPDGSFVMEGGNQGGHVFMTRHGGYSFRTPPANVLAALTGKGAGGTTSTTWANWLKGQAYLETSLRNSHGYLGHSASGYFQFMPGTAAQAMRQGLGDPRSGDYDHQAAVTKAWIEKNHPAAAAAIARGDYASAAMMLHSVWPSLPGGSQPQTADRYNHWQHILTGDDHALPSPAIAPRNSGAGGQVMQINLKVDGRTLAQVVHKHTARMGNMPPRSGRLPDPFGNNPSLPV